MLGLGWGGVKFLCALFIFCYMPRLSILSHIHTISHSHRCAFPVPCHQNGKYPNKSWCGIFREQRRVWGGGTKKWSGSNPAHREDLIIDRRE